MRGTSLGWDSGLGLPKTAGGTSLGWDSGLGLPKTAGGTNLGWDDDGISPVNILVEKGGPASHEELAAIVLALSGIMAEHGRSYPPWQQAALREGLGAPPARCAADVGELSPGVPAVFS